MQLAEMRANPRSVWLHMRAAELKIQAELNAQADAVIAFDQALDAVKAVEMEELEVGDVKPEPLPMWLHEPPEPERPSRCIDCFCQAMCSILMCIITSKFL
jgi:hypothetical protein